MMENAHRLIDRLADEHTLELGEYRQLVHAYCPDLARYAAARAVEVRWRIYGRGVYVRGLIEIGNVCKNDCKYCGIRASNAACDRYRLTADQVLECCEHGYELGFRTFVLQGGEDPHFSDDMLCGLIGTIKEAHPDCAVTLSLGERGRESFARLKRAGADRYLLRHETADARHYAQLHPRGMTLQARMRALRDLADLGYQVGAGFMVQSPGQTDETLAADLKFLETFQPAMCGIGPFIAHRDTPFAHEPSGTVELTCYLLSLIRLACPSVLLPATTALGTARADGREAGILAGANVVMPNLTPACERRKYELYDGKIAGGAEAAENVAELRERMRAIGYEVLVDRGDVARE